MNIPIERQLEIISARAVDLVSRAELRRKLEKSAETGRPLRVKYGADPSAPDIHLGHAVALNKLREFQDLGHTVVFIIGDFTGLIGDPSGRSETRKPETPEQLAANAKTYQEQAFKILDRARTEVRFNSEWSSRLSFADALILTSKLTVAQILERDDFRKRMQGNQPVSMMELLYPVVQGYDSVCVEADVEIGGTDQLFNLLVGRDMQKAFSREPQVVLTLPLLEGLDGSRKMSKSLGNYVGITESPREMFGKIMSIPDSLMGRYMYLALALPEKEVLALESGLASGKRHPREVKDEIARAIVARFHDAAAAESASQEFKRVFSERKKPAEIPVAVIPMSSRPNGKLRVTALLIEAGLADSNGTARRLIQQGGVKIGDRKITDISAELEIPEGCVVQAGKRGFARIVSS